VQISAQLAAMANGSSLSVSDVLAKQAMFQRQRLRCVAMRFGSQLVLVFLVHCQPHWSNNGLAVFTGH